MTSTPPFQNLIGDVLSGIFVDCLPKDDFAQLRRREVPLNVSHVCRHWRHVSLSTLRLWASLSYRGSYERACPALRSFLQRSRDIGFHFKFDVVGGEHVDIGQYVSADPFPSSSATEVLRELSPHYERIKGITLRIPLTMVSSMKYVLEEFPALEHLSFQVFEVFFYPNNPYKEIDKRFWNIIPNLVSLEIKGAHYLRLDPGRWVMCSNLKHLALSVFCVLRELIHIIDLCPALESLYLDLSGPSFTKSNTADVRPMTLPSIRTLEMRAEKPVAHAMIRDVFKFFQLPNLRHLVLQWRTSQESTLETFILTSRPPLEELSLSTMDDIDFKEGPIIRVLQLLPGLRRLRIRLQHAILQELTLTDIGDGGSCPLLEEVTLEIKGKDEPTDESVQAWKAADNMIRSRWKPTNSEGRGSTACCVTTRNGRTLRKIFVPDIHECVWQTGHLFSGIRDLQREGLDVNFSAELMVPYQEVAENE